MAKAGECNFDKLLLATAAADRSVRRYGNAAAPFPDQCFPFQLRNAVSKYASRPPDKKKAAPSSS